MEVAVLTEKEIATTNNNIAVVLLKVKSEIDYNINILGKSMIDWVRDSVGDFNITEIDYDTEDDVVSLIKPHLTDAEYTAVLFSDTPLLKHKTFIDVLDYVLIKQANVCKLTRGYIFKTEYIRNADFVYMTQPQFFEEEDFIAVTNSQQLAVVTEVLKNRINAFHCKNGVRILDQNNVYIESGVAIEKGVVIYPNNFICGACLIGKNTTLYPNNYIENSILEEGCKVTSSIIKGSKIPKNTEIKPFSSIIN